MKAPGFSHRDWLPDQLKGWAVVWMIGVHSVELFLQPALLTQPIPQLLMFMGGVPAAPLFMVMMGYYAGRRYAAPGKLIMRGLKLLVWGLLLNIGLNASLLLKWILHQTTVNPLHYVFGVDILFLAGLSLIITGILKLTKPAWFVWIFLAFFTSLFAHQITITTESHKWTDYFLAFFTGNVSWSYFPLLPWLAYPLLGVGIKKLVDQYPFVLNQSRYRFYTAVPAVLIFLAGLLRGWRISTNLDLYYHHGLLFFIWAVSFIFLIALLLQAFQKSLSCFIGSWIRFLGVRVTWVYVIQWLIIGNTGTWFYQQFSTGAVLLIFIGVLTVSTFLTYVYHQLKIK